MTRLLTITTLLLVALTARTQCDPKFQNAALVFEEGMTIGKKNFHSFKRKVEQGDDVLMNGHLTFESGAEGEFDFVQFYFTPGHGITIQEGANVTFTDCTFQSCGDNWRGFDVKADRTTQAASGILTLTNSKVYYAQRGIYTQDASGPFAQWTNYHGGQINCTGSWFVNCGVAFECHYTRYTTNATGLVPKVAFVKCLFLTDNDYTLHHAMPYQALSRHHDSFGYSYSGCTFRNTMTQVAEWHDRGRGIHSFNSVFDFKRYEPGNNNPANYVRGKMEGFDAAIDAYGGKKRAITVRWSDFEQNRVGVRLTNNDFFRIYGNKFKVGKATGVAALDGQTTIDTGPEITDIWYEAVANMGGRHFVLGENIVEGIPLSAGGISNDRLRIGFRVRDTQTPDDEVRLNDMTGLDYAVMADGWNATISGLSGLRVVCNDFAENGFDIRVHDFQSSMDVSVGSGQFDAGQYDQYSADNHFTQQTSFLNDQGRIFNTGEVVTYYFNGANTSKDPCYGTNETDCSDFITPYLVLPVIDPIFEPNPCIAEFPTHISHGPSKVTELVGIAEEAYAEFKEAEIAYHALTDGGDSEALLTAIENAYGSETLDLRDEMLENSPNLSDVTLVAVADNTTGFPHPVAAEIFAANPQCLHDWRFMLYLTTKTDPIPEYLMEALEAIADTASTDNLLLTQLNRTRMQSVKHYNRALWAMADTTLYAEEDYASVVNSIHLYRHTYPLADELMNSGDNSEAMKYFTDSDSLFYVHIAERPERLIFERWLNFREELTENARTWDSLTVAENDTLLSILAHYRTWPGRAAMEVLNFFHDSTYVIPPAMDTLAWSPRRARVPMISSTTLRVLPFPNPASIRVFFLLTGPPEIGTKLNLKVTDPMGRVVHTTQMTYTGNYLQLDVLRWASGAYFFTMDINGKGEYNGKFVVQR